MRTKIDLHPAGDTVLSRDYALLAMTDDDKVTASGAVVLTPLLCTSLM